MKHFTLSIAEGITQQSDNNYYRKQSEIHSLQELLQAVRFDHVAGIFKNNHRKTPNFIQADVLMMDCDNGHTADPAGWLTPEKLHEQLQGVAFYAVYSKSHMKDKIDKEQPTKPPISPRPRFHVYLPLSHIINDAEQIRTLKETLLAVIPEFDNRAKDTARYFDGVLDPQGLVFEGDTCIDTYLPGVYADLFTAQQEDTRADDSTGEQRRSDDDADETHSNVHHQQGKGLIEQAIAISEHKPYFDFISNPDKIIPEGNRHNILLGIAVGALCNEDTDSALETYKRACRQCRPPHDERDIARIWRDAKEYTKRKMKEQQEQQEQQQHAGRRKRSKPLTLAAVEKLLYEQNIRITFNLITKQMEVPALPEHGEGMLQGYSQLTDYERQKQSKSILPSYIAPMLKNAGYSFTDAQLKRMIECIALVYYRNPIKDMLDATTWDGTDRIRILIDKLELCHSRHGNKAGFYCSCLRKWLHQAIALAFNDEGRYSPAFVLTLQGRQGIGKTSFFRALAVRPEWFREGATINTQDKDTIIQATAVWICELGELDATLRKEQSDLKSFLTRTADTYRRPYAEAFENIERRTCFCATVNPQEVNTDITGSRRFVYIPLDGIDATAFKEFIYHTMTPEWVAQLWRQVYEELYLPDPESYYMTDEDLRMTEDNNSPFRKTIKAETELRDLIAWAKIGTYDADNNPFEDFEEYSATDVKKAYKSTLSRYSANQIGQALKLLCEEYGASSRLLNGRTLYTIPSITNREDEDTHERPSRYNGWQGGY